MTGRADVKAPRRCRTLPGTRGAVAARQAMSAAAGSTPKPSAQTSNSTRM